MGEISVRLLAEEDWELFRSVRLAALAESPESFVATHDEEVALDEDYWRQRMTRSHRFVAEQDGEVIGVVSVGPHGDDPQSGDLFGLWVAPEHRSAGVSSRLVKAAAQRAVEDGRERLFYWVSTENGRGIAFASNVGFRVSSERRPALKAHEEFGDQEIAMVLSLESDPFAVPNPTSGQANSD